MHRIYTSEAIVLGGRTQGEADRLVTLFTKEYGLIRAVSKSVRREASKLRYSLADRSRVLVSLVKGKEVWRITNTMSLGSWKSSAEYNRSIARVSKLMERLMPPETIETKLFQTFERFLDAAESKTIPVKMLEIAVVLHLLRDLGYVADNPRFDGFFKQSLSVEGVETLVPYSKEALDIINNALHHSHL